VTSRDLNLMQHSRNVRGAVYFSAADGQASHAAELSSCVKWVFCVL